MYQVPKYIIDIFPVLISKCLKCNLNIGGRNHRLFRRPNHYRIFLNEEAKKKELKKTFADRNMPYKYLDEFKREIIDPILNTPSKGIGKMNKEKINKNINNYVSNIEDMFEEYNKIKSNTNRLKLEYKMWHFSKYSNIDEIINAKEDMLLFLLKQKFFKNQKNYPRLKMESSLKKKSVNNIIREYFNNVEDDEYKFGKKINFYKY